jgi:hypothetical protein
MDDKLPAQNQSPHNSIQPVIAPQPSSQPSVQVPPQAPHDNPKQSKAIFIAVVIAVILILLGAIGWALVDKSNNKKASNQNKMSSSAPLNPYDKCLKDYSDANLCHYYVASLNPKAFGPFILTDVTNLSGHQTTITNENDGNGNSKTTEPGLNLIEVNGIDYVQTSDGPWVKQRASKPTSNSNPTASVNTFGIDSTNGSRATFKALGTVSCDNVTCYKYQVLNCCSVPTTEWFSFDTKTYKLIEYYTSNNFATADVTYSYGPVPPITAPSPVAQ